MAELDTQIELLVRKLPAHISQYQFVMDWYTDGDSKGSGKYLEAGVNVNPNISFEDEIQIIDVAKKIVMLIKDEHSNRVTLLVSKDGTYDCKAEYIDSMDTEREEEFRIALGDEDYEKLVEERKQYKERLEEEQTEPSLDKPLSLGQLFGVIRDELQGSVPEAWASMILKVRILQEGENKSIDTDFLWRDKHGQEKLFEPENPIVPMNALLQIKDIMAADGTDWNESTIIIHNDGEVEMESKP